MSQTFDLTLHTRIAEFEATADFVATGVKGAASFPAKSGAADFEAVADFEASAAAIDRTGTPAFEAVADFTARAGQEFDLTLFMEPVGTEQTWDLQLVTNTRSGSAAFEAVAEFNAVSGEHNWYDIECDVDVGDVYFRADASFAALGRKNAYDSATFEAICEASLGDGGTAPRRFASSNRRKSRTIATYNTGVSGVRYNKSERAVIQ